MNGQWEKTFKIGDNPVQCHVSRQIRELRRKNAGQVSTKKIISLKFFYSYTNSANGKRFPKLLEEFMHLDQETLTTESYTGDVYGKAVIKQWFYCSNNYSNTKHIAADYVISRHFQMNIINIPSCGISYLQTVLFVIPY